MWYAVPRLSLLASLGALAGCGSRAEPPFEFTRLEVPGSASTVASGINASGQIVGWYRDAAGDRVRGFRFRDGAYTPVDHPGVMLTQLHGIGPDGDIVGSYRRAGEPKTSFHGFLLRTSGEFVDVGVAGHVNSIAQRILPDGTILGCYHDADWTTTMRGVTFSRAGPVALEMPATMSNGGTPDGRKVVGLVMDTRRAFFMEAGVVSLFDAPGSVRTEAWDINPSGAVVGLFEDSTGATHGYLRQGGTFTTVDYPGAASTMVFGINAAGDLVGAAKDSAGTQHGFLATRVRNPRR
jgi:probable HAF family extracellular repeat protein